MFSASALGIFSRMKTSWRRPNARRMETMNSRPSDASLSTISCLAVGPPCERQERCTCASAHGIVRGPVPWKPRRGMKTSATSSASLMSSSDAYGSPLCVSLNISTPSFAAAARR